MYKISDKTPSPRAEKNEIADYFELQAIINSSCSIEDVLSPMEIDKEEDHSQGTSEDNELEPIMDDVIYELVRRKDNSNNKYPFEITNNGYSLQYNRNISETNTIYLFLLFATRLNMKTDKIQNQLDGTLLFEELCEIIGRNYLGENTKSFLMGTSNDIHSFEKKINRLIIEITEGEKFLNRNQGSAGRFNDDGLDIVFWKPFIDKMAGKVICFAQCKTGTNWKDHLRKLQPDNFCHKWFLNQPTSDPLRLFFISESIMRTYWFSHSSDAGILFDRCRIMEFCYNIDINLINKIRKWNEFVLKNELS